MSPSDDSSGKSIPLHRVALILPFVDFLRDVGAPVKSAFSRNHLPIEALEDVNNYIPSHYFYKFLIDMSRSQGIEDLGFLVGKQFGANCADPKMTALLTQAPTLYHGIQQASDMVNKTISNCNVGLLIPPALKHVYFFHSPSCSVTNPAIEQISGFGLMILCGMVRTYTGPQWQPTEIGLMTSRLPSSHIGEYFPNTRMKLSQPYTYITVDKELLKLSRMPEKRAVSESIPIVYRDIELNFTGSLKQAMSSYSRISKLNIDTAAELCSMSKRALQRTLLEEGTCFRKLLDQVLLDHATRMLKNPGMTVANISSQLGYSEVSHFIRAFRRVTGTTPHYYRQQFKH